MADFTERAEQLLSQLEDEVRREQSRAWQDRAHFLAKALYERIESGWTLSPIQLSPIANQKTLRLQADLSRSKYREGDRIRIHLDFLSDVEGFDAVIVREEEHQLILYPESRPDAFLYSDQPLVVDPAYLDLSSYYLEALEHCSHKQQGQAWILPLLLGDLEMSVEGHLFDAALDEAEERGLNDAQADAYASCLACSHAYYVQGPPGTGKTRVLAEVARSLVEQGERVWVSALTHRAINHALTRIRKLDAHIGLARICDQRNEVPEEIEHYESIQESPLAHRAGGYVIGATPFMGMTQRLRDWDCDTLIFDEASQVTLPMALMAMLKAKRVLFFGDDQQLPPVQLACPCSECQERSVLKRVPVEAFRSRLSLGYRMHVELCDWPSRTFYDAELRSHPSLLKLPLPFPEQPGRLFRQSCESPEEEIQQLLTYTGRLLHRAGRSPQDLAVLSPFRAHCSAIRRQFRSQGLSIRVDTVERMQGQECDWLIFALGVQDPEQAGRLADFLFQPQRLNVAITRARAGVILLGNPLIWEGEFGGRSAERHSLWKEVWQQAHVLEASWP